jgi:hypothetical protein
MFNKWFIKQKPAIIPNMLLLVKKPWNFPSEMAAFKTPKSQKSQKSERRRPL